MKKIYLLVLMVVLAFAGKAAKPAMISATVDGYTGSVVDFEFIDNPENNMSYPYRENNIMGFEVELDEPSLLKINAWIWLLVSPGDEIHIDIHYEGTKYKTSEISGNEKAVLLNETIRDMRNSRIAIRYKMNPLAAMVTLIAPKDYYQTTLDQWTKEKAMLEAIESEVDPFAYYYIYSELEGTFLSNLVKYPYLAADYLKKPLEECISEGYWDVLNDYELRTDAGSFKSFAYLGWLLEYQKYMDSKKAHNENKPFSYFTMDLQKGYDSIVSFYEGDLLDSALYVYLYNAITGQRNFELVEKLTREYAEKYSNNEFHKKMLLEMLQ